ncbi:hypothetical protein Q7C_1804 [Methylophaga frappieri]|uniref:Uncharacterized protein n=1 Tax=Methylophaga frappieri (strain ATCC BAA-2434 / DSM 25690 / JAM7) TaxID=754477 RepID=I1YJ52_METFJ|nr:hypothetical protein [Methylophaga frappieri]AFJ02945.1 hypothetical protein Q7C_1804 [Methylophaga frappieri]
MWAKTLIGFVVSLVLNLSLMVNIAYLLPLSRQVYLLIGFVGGILLWAAIMTVFYCHDRLAQPLKYCLPLLVVSAAVNALFVTGILV